MKDWGRDGESNRAFPLTPPSPSGKGRTCERFVSVRNVGLDPTYEARRRGVSTNNTTERPGALNSSRRAEWFSFSLRERVGVRGKGLLSRLWLSFQPLAPVLIPPKIARNDKKTRFPVQEPRLHNNPDRLFIRLVLIATGVALSSFTNIQSRCVGGCHLLGHSQMLSQRRQCADHKLL